jgi:3-oxoacyl-[acyl-carrier protein] reductase
VDLGLDGRVALVTGASKGLGRATAAALAGEGVRVAISSRSRERIDAAAHEIGAVPFVYDAGDPDGAAALVDAVEEALGALDVLVVNTGGPPTSGDPLALGRDQWEQTYRQLVLTPMALVGRVLPGMRERGFGRVLNVSASSAREPLPGLVLSSAHRASMLTAFKTISDQVASDGVTLNTLLPGRFGTDRLFDLIGGEENAGVIAESIPAKRLGRVEEFGAAAAFLCSVPAAYITGEAVHIDGGLVRRA